MSEIIRCASCLAPLRLDLGPIATCAYCGAQTRLDAPAAVVELGKKSGARLAEAVSFVTPTRTIPWLEADAALPIHRTETLSTQTDNQDALHVKLVQGTTPLADFRFPIAARAPRGVPKIALTVRVSAGGAMSLTVSEGSSHVDGSAAGGTPQAKTVDHDGIRVRVVA